MTTSGKRDTQRQASEAVLGDGSLEIDLADPPSREDLAMGDGQEFSVLQREDEEPVQVTVRFSDGHSLATPAAVLGPTSESPDGPPTSLVIRRHDMTLDELESVLRDSVETFGTDPRRVSALVEGARSAEGGQSDFKRSLPTELDGAERLEIQPIVTALEGRVSVNYTVSWGPR